MDSSRSTSESPVSFTGIPKRVTESLEPSVGRKRTSSFRWLMLGLFVFLSIATAIFWVPQEISNWYHAAALEAHDQGDRVAAKSLMDSACQWNPQDTSIYRTRSRWKLDRKDYEGSLRDASHAVRIDPQDLENFNARSSVYQRMGRFEEAVQDQTELIDKFRQHRDDSNLHQALNNRAYFRALGEFELDQALDDIQQAILLWAQDYSAESPSYLDTRGYIQYLLGNIEEAEKDLSRATELAKKEHAIVADRFRGHEELLTEMNEYLAVVYRHRGLVYQAQGETELAQDYLQRADDLGYNPEEGIR